MKKTRLWMQKHYINKRFKKKFRFDHCWNLLRLQLKWLDVICKQKPSLRSKGGNFFSSMSSPSTSETPINLAEDDVPNTSFIHRPLGKNVKKRKMRDHEKNIMKMQIIVDLLKEMMERRKQIDAAYLHAIEEKKKTNAREVELMKRLLNLEEERQRREQVAYEVRIMTMDMSGMTPIAQEYYRRLTMRILQGHSGGV
ncbi:hypothetical protein F0562_013916 [Nyssa sinensis]|uniref:No apical meristem-associated C-terminal domain-containing protein n=1 Tax=Nyssa sinensis TaxID=561372 RepID=A0A5J4ZNU5_9ASTE|nr:hypothetical protein F0562_013916 [Nyssa sinensis]